MVQKITGEAPFQVLATNFSISPSQQDYTLQISADGTNYSDLFTVSAGQTKMVTNVANGSYYRMKNNASEVSINWRTQCNDGQGGGGGGSQYILPPATEQTLGGIKVGQGLSVQADGTLSASGGSVDPTAVQELIDANNTKIEEGEIIAGMAKQLYSPDGIVSEGVYAYRTTAGDEDVSSGPARLYKIEANSTNYPSVLYNDSVVLERNGEPVEGFEADIEWGDSETWNDVDRYSDFYNVYGETITKARIGVVDAPANAVYEFQVNMGSSNYDASILRSSSNGNWSQYSNTVATADPNVFDIIRNDVKYGTITIDNGWVIAEVDTYIRRLNMTQGSIPDDYQVCTAIEIPNDIPLGETTYTYDGSDWDTTLPQAIVSMTINDAPYSPENGDEIIVTRNIYAEGNAEYAAPEAFVAVGLNSYSKDEDTPICKTEEDGNGGYAITLRSVPNLEDGYVVFSNADAITSVVIEDGNGTESATTELTAGRLYVAHTTSEQPFIKVATNDIGSICIHPRWSGYNDEAFEDYEQNEISLVNFAEYPLLTVGEAKNVWDVINNKAIVNIGIMEFSNQAVEELIADGKELGVDFEIDENNIYYILDEAEEYEVESEYEYKDNDFGVEYLYDSDGLISIPVKVETHYMTNLVDKLRRLKTDFIHLDSVEAEGEVGKTYEYQGRIMRWVEGSGYTAEWLKSPSQMNSDEGTGLIYATIPDGKVLFEIYYSSYPHRKVVYSGETLYLTETAGTVVCAVTIGNKFKFECNGSTYRYIEGEFVNGHIGFWKVSSPSFSNVWSGETEGGHYELVDKYNYPYISASEGIPVWNDKGQIIRRNTGISTKNIYINATGTSSSYRTTYITNGTNNGPDRWFAPITGGVAGQTLVSGGDNAAPVWETRIKVQEITSDAYDALVQAGTTDPNTLYLINDN